MKKTVMTLFLLLACSLAVAAVQPQNQPQTDERNMPSSSNIGDKVTVTGCLMQGTEANSYVLSNVTPSDMSHQSTDTDPMDRSQDPSGSPTEMARTEMSYTLIPESRVDLKRHVGQRVEVTGKMIETTSRTTQSSRATTPSGQSSTIHSTTEMSGQPQMKVSSIRQISQTCQ